MRAAYVRWVGPDSVIEIGDLPVPTPGASEVLVKVTAVAINPVDNYIRTGRFQTPVPLPFVVGRDLVGTVVESGSPALGFAPGERVWCNSMGHDGRPGAISEYVVVPVDRLYRLPDGADPEQGVALAQPAATAYLGCFVHGNVRAGETVFVGGGGGNIGLAAIRMARMAGARVLATARPDDHQRCRDAGAEVVVDYHAAPMVDRMLDAAGGVDVYWETSGRHDFDRVERVAAPGCRVLVTAAAEQRPTVPLPQLYMRDVSLIGFVISRATVDQLRAAADLINPELAAGTLTARIADRLPLGRTAEAYRRLAEGRVRGRLLVDLAGRTATR
ncbi:NADPH:quinone reductase [Microlunatus elymi]|uniref:NADPH:quinone reductase n=1 Tax=Microlunatus elymi TaxID=2596828 RepID=A0A516PYM5_9ACTN|nr:NADPH:quinone reductase [Microlunatus elymi]QDP96270.1 NADPH:quinone reductase [Microlunatus elymi]